MGSPVVHFEIGGPDPTRLSEFYSELFDWHVDTNNPMGYGMVDTHADEKNKGINGGIPKQDEAWVTVYMEVPDPQKSLDRAVELGAEIVMPVTEMPMVTLALFKDPAGNKVGVVKSAE